MAVYERSYQPYTGPWTDRRTRFLILAKYAYQDIFKSKAFIAFFVACFIWPLMLMLATYLSYNLTFLKTVAAQAGADFKPGTLFGLTFDGPFFMIGFMSPQFWMSLFLTFVVAPALISTDMRNNGLPLYLSRPFGRADYILGKLSVLMILLSLVTWVPGLLLWGLHAYLAGGGWWRTHFYLAFGIFVGSWVLILVLSLVGLSLSAYVKWKPLARLGLFGVFIIGSGFGSMINGILGTRWGSIVDLGQQVAVVWSGLFRVDAPFPLPVWAAWICLAVICGLFLWLLARKIEAYEVARS